MGEKQNHSLGNWKDEINKTDVKNSSGIFDITGEDEEKIRKKAIEFVEKKGFTDPYQLRIMVKRVKTYLENITISIGDDSGKASSQITDSNISEMEDDLEIIRGEIIGNTKNDIELLRNHKAKENAKYISSYLLFLVNYISNTSTFGKMFPLGYGVEQSLDSDDLIKLNSAIKGLNRLINSNKNIDEEIVIKTLLEKLGATLFKKLIFNKFVLFSNRFKPGVNKIVERDLNRYRNKDNLSEKVKSELALLKSNIAAGVPQEIIIKKGLVINGLKSDIFYNGNGVTQADISDIFNKAVKDEEYNSKLVTYTKEQLNDIHEFVAYIDKAIKKESAEKRAREIKEREDQHNKWENDRKAKREKEMSELNKKRAIQEEARLESLKTRREYWYGEKQKVGNKADAYKLTRESLEAKVKIDLEDFNTRYPLEKAKQEKLIEERKKQSEAWRKANELLARKIEKAIKNNKEFDEIFEKLEQERFWDERRIRYNRERLERVLVFGNMQIDTKKLRSEIENYLKDLEKKLASKTDKKVTSNNTFKENKPVIKAGKSVDIVFNPKETARTDNLSIFDELSNILSGFSVTDIDLETTRFIEFIKGLLTKEEKGVIVRPKSEKVVIKGNDKVNLGGANKTLSVPESLPSLKGLKGSGENSKGYIFDPIEQIVPRSPILDELYNGKQNNITLTELPYKNNITLKQKNGETFTPSPMIEGILRGIGGKGNKLETVAGSQAPKGAPTQATAPVAEQSVKVDKIATAPAGISGQKDIEQQLTENQETKKLIDWITLFKAVTRVNSDEFVNQVFYLGGLEHFGYEGRNGINDSSDNEILKKNEAIMYLDNGKYALRFYIEGSSIKYQAYEKKNYIDEFNFGAGLENNLKKEYQIYKDNRDDFSFSNDGKLDIDKLLKKDN